ncbi:NADH-UBIQUINONE OXIDOREDUCTASE PDSW SUBUNIT [Plasmopara halstedii]|uniref:NADH-UBIQUINONE OXIDOREDUCTASE PDSW SUBUNIT n=1 Tax=Plasmopara halstedii TaxID=4781 RepID=A0A0P1AQC7_PLAHL|nr:NADH-UBIQUINONE OXIDOREDUCTASE PDSW SUBUNIT [Plasmopara halstedii]CEG43737.1 NADH-UBIQUINONE OXIDOREDUCTASE PDSW SUBUNIT [Plasmopara halstedii]|eukprot:XP_024580106.1 NADH-UBIQUINONE OXIDOREDUCTASE PDSW SUBUNIT [Plasmopara halstedii]
MYATQLRSKDEIIAIRAAELEYAKRVLLAQETVKAVREELAACYRENGVNHKIACKSLREEYAKLIQDPTHGAGYPTRPVF